MALRPNNTTPSNDMPQPQHSHDEMVAFEKEVLDNVGYELDSSGDDDDFRLEDDDDFISDDDDGGQLTDEEAARMPANEYGDFNLKPEQKPTQQQQAPTQQQQYQQPDLAVPVQSPGRPPWYKIDEKGNCVDSSGRILAHAGRERELFQENVKHRVDLDKVVRTANQFQQGITRAVELAQHYQSELQKSKEAYSKYNLSETEVTESLELRALAKTNPVEAIKQILTKAAMDGTDLSSLGLQNGGGLDIATLAKSIRQQVGEDLKPIKEYAATEQQQRQQQAEYQRLEQEAVRDIANFFNANPEAKPYAPVLNKVLANPDFAHMGIEQAWDKIQLWLLRNPQSRQTPGQAPTGQPQNRRVPPSNRTTNPARPNNQRSDAIAPIDMSYEDIIKDVLKSA